MSNPWREAALDLCAIDFCEFHEDDPHKTLLGLVETNIKMALDPAISSDAVKLRDTHLPELARLREEHQKFKTTVAQFLSWLRKNAYPGTGSPEEFLVELKCASESDAAELSGWLNTLQDAVRKT